jgi:hypothetical protein
MASDTDRTKAMLTKLCKDANIFEIRKVAINAGIDGIPTNKRDLNTKGVLSALCAAAEADVSNVRVLQQLSDRIDYYKAKKEIDEKLKGEYVFEGSEHESDYENE